MCVCFVIWIWIVNPSLKTVLKSEILFVLCLNEIYEYILKICLDHFILTNIIIIVLLLPPFFPFSHFSLKKILSLYISLHRRPSCLTLLCHLPPPLVLLHHCHFRNQRLSIWTVVIGRVQGLIWFICCFDLRATIGTTTSFLSRPLPFLSHHHPLFLSWSASSSFWLMIDHL